MFSLKKYFKPFILGILLAMILLFVQAMCDLKLPDYMSDIVNIGIQSKGIEQVAPEVISKEGWDWIQYFMEPDEITYITERYTYLEQGNLEIENQYPGIKSTNVYVLKENLEKEEEEQVSHYFAIASKTLFHIMEQMTPASGENQGFDRSKMELFFSQMHLLPEEVMQQAREEAKQTPESMLNSVGLVITQSFYQELGLDSDKIQSDYIWNTGVKMLGVCALGIMSAMIVGFLGSKIGAGIGRNIRKDVFEKVQTFSTAEFNRFSAASLITRTTNDITQLQNFIVMMIRMLAYAPIMGIGSLIMMAQKTTELIWTIALACGLIILLIVYLFKAVFPKIKKVQKLTDKINLVAKENLSGLMVIRAFGTQNYEEKRFDEVNHEVMKTNQFINRSMGMMMPSMMFIMNGLNLLILWMGADAISVSTLQVGDLMAVMQYGIEVVMSFLFVSMIFVMWPRASVSANRIKEVLETPNSIHDPKNPQTGDEGKKGFVEFKHVTFQYPGADETILEDITFTAKPGQTTAIIGATGSGKTTVVNLIPRLFDVCDGEVLVNGVNVKNLTQFELHNQIGYVPQKGNLLSGTIESNLKYGNQEATDEWLEKCVEVAQATEFIESKTERYHASISQGAKNVSGGQKQRLSIARALVKNSPIYIFDDTFSALDFKTDSNLRKALKNHSKDSTVILVAQRVSTIMHAEQIIVLNEGKIVGIGTHDELLRDCSTYYEIAASQLSEEELKNGREK